MFITEVVAPPLLLLPSVPALPPEVHPLEEEADRWHFQVLLPVFGIVDRLQCMYQEAHFIRMVVCGATPVGRQTPLTLEDCATLCEAFLSFILRMMSSSPVSIHHNGRVSSAGILSIHNTTYLIVLP